MPGRSRCGWRTLAGADQGRQPRSCSARRRPAGSSARRRPARPGVEGVGRAPSRRPRPRSAPVASSPAAVAVSTSSAATGSSTCSRAAAALRSRTPRPPVRSAGGGVGPPVVEQQLDAAYGLEGRAGGRPGRPARRRARGGQRRGRVDGLAGGPPAAQRQADLAGEHHEPSRAGHQQAAARAAPRPGWSPPRPRRGVPRGRRSPSPPCASDVVEQRPGRRAQRGQPRGDLRRRSGRRREAAARWRRCPPAKPSVTAGQRPHPSGGLPGQREVEQPRAPPRSPRRARRDHAPAAQSDRAVGRPPPGHPARSARGGSVSRARGAARTGSPHARPAGRSPEGPGWRGRDGRGAGGPAARPASGAAGRRACGAPAEPAIASTLPASACPAPPGRPSRRDGPRSSCTTAPRPTSAGCARSTRTPSSPPAGLRRRRRHGRARRAVTSPAERGRGVRRPGRHRPTTGRPGGRGVAARRCGACQRRIIEYAAGPARGRSRPRWYAGTTVVVAAAGRTDEAGPGWLVANLGDSRAYRLPRGRLHQVSVDHSLVQELVDAGEITPEEAAIHPERHVVTRALGGPRRRRARPLLWSRSTGRPAAAVLRRRHRDARRRARSPSCWAVPPTRVTRPTGLVAAAVEAGGHDNATAVVVDVVGWARR